MSRAPDNASNPAVADAKLCRVQGQSFCECFDSLAVEEPLEIRVRVSWNGKLVSRTASVTMRTPGQDLDLARGFLYTEGVVRSAGDFDDVCHVGRPRGNVVRVTLRAGVNADWSGLARNGYTHSSCGVCGKRSIAAVQVAQRYRIAAGPVVSPEVIGQLPAALRDAQDAFRRTGGLHAAALFDTRGNLLAVREDVGRHNALDKLIGAFLVAGELPLVGRVLLVSGRASFELVQKATLAGIPVLVAVGAPSSLAVSLARDRGMTLLGFVRDGRFNVYCGGERVRASSARATELATHPGVSDVQPAPRLAYAEIRRAPAPGV